MGIHSIHGTMITSITGVMSVCASRISFTAEPMAAIREAMVT